MHTITFSEKKEAMNSKERKKRYMEGLGGKQRKWGVIL